MEIYFIVGAFAFIIIIAILKMYNGLIKAKNKVNQAESGIDVYLKQRFDLIPNLVECVKAYAEHELQVLSEITRLRSEYNEKPKDMEKAQIINNKMNDILALAESYPNLKASEQFLNLQRTLSKLESQLQAARRIYNIEVTNYNNLIDTVPSNIIAKIFRMKHAKLFEIEDNQKENIETKFEG